jgi:hypothetical protein
MQRVPISLRGIPLAFVFLATSVLWSGETDNRHAAPALVAGMALLAICTVWTWISVLRRGPVYHGLRPESRPRRWVLILWLIDFAVFPRWLSSLDDLAARAFLTDADPVFCDLRFSSLS